MGTNSRKSNPIYTRAAAPPVTRATRVAPGPAPADVSRPRNARVLPVERAVSLFDSFGPYAESGGRCRGCLGPFRQLDTGGQSTERRHASLRQGGGDRTVGANGEVRRGTSAAASDLVPSDAD